MLSHPSTQIQGLALLVHIFLGPFFVGLSSQTSIPSFNSFNIADTSYMCLWSPRATTEVKGQEQSPRRNKAGLKTLVILPHKYATADTIP